MRYVSLIIEENRIPLSKPWADEMSLIDRFSHAYEGLGLRCRCSLNRVSSLIRNHWARGSVDGIHDMTNPDSIGFFEFTDLFGIIDQFQKEIWEVGSSAYLLPLMP